MFNKKQKDPSQLQDAIARAYSELEKKAVGTTEYNNVLDQIAKLHKMQEAEKPDQVSMETAATIAANLVGILLIIRHEHVNVITSRALDRVTKLR